MYYLTKSVWLLALLAGLFGCGMAANHHHHQAGAAPAAGKPAAIHWVTLAEGEQLARDQGLPLMVDFYVPSACARCEGMNESVYQDPEVAQRVNQWFVPVRIDLTGTLTARERVLGETYEYRSDCLLLFLDAQGTVIEDATIGRFCFAEALSKQQFLGYLQRAKALAESLFSDGDSRPGSEPK